MMKRVEVTEREEVGLATLPAHVVAKNLDFYYGTNHVLHNIEVIIPKRIVTALIGPSGCGKSTFLRTINRMNDLVPHAVLKGEVLVDGLNIYERNVDLVTLRKKVGMVFQRSNPFPM